MINLSTCPHSDLSKWCFAFALGTQHWDNGVLVSSQNIGITWYFKLLENFCIFPFPILFCNFYQFSKCFDQGRHNTREVHEYGPLTRQRWTGFWIWSEVNICVHKHDTYEYGPLTRHRWTGFWIWSEDNICAHKHDTSVFGKAFEQIFPQQGGKKILQTIWRLPFLINANLFYLSSMWQFDDLHLLYIATIGPAVQTKASSTRMWQNYTKNDDNY